MTITETLAQWKDAAQLIGSIALFVIPAVLTVAIYLRQRATSEVA